MCVKAKSSLISKTLKCFTDEKTDVGCLSNLKVVELV